MIWQINWQVFVWWETLVVNRLIKHTTISTFIYLVQYWAILECLLTLGDFQIHLVYVQIRLSLLSQQHKCHLAVNHLLYSCNLLHQGRLPNEKIVINLIKTIVELLIFEILLQNLTSNILENKPECTFLIPSGCQVATFQKTDFIMVFIMVYIFFEYVTLCAIWYHLYNFKNLKRTHRRVLLLVKLHKDICNFSKSNTHPWVFSTFSYIVVKMVPNCAKRHIWTDFWYERSTGLDHDRGLLSNQII